MALQKAYTHSSGAEFPEAYHRVFLADLVRRIGSGGTIIEEFTGAVDIFKDSTARDEGKQPVRSFQFGMSGSDYATWFETTILDQTNINTIERTYEYMKTQSDLQGINYTDSTSV